MAAITVTLENLKEVHGANAANIFRQVANLGGFGWVDPNHSGGLDLSGIEDKETLNQINALISKPQTPDASPTGDKNKGGAK